MSNLRERIEALTLGLLLVVLAIPAMAQIDIGSLSGVVTDPQGGVITGAQVTQVETSTHTTHVTITNSDGVYMVLSLPTGTYDLTDHPPGLSNTNQPCDFAGQRRK